MHEGLELDLYSNDDQFIVTGTLHYYDDQVEWYVTLDWNTLRENTEYQ